MFGREINFPVDVMFGDTPDRKDNSCPSEYVEWLKQSMELSFNIASENLKVAASRQRKYYNKGLKPRQYAVNDLVWRWYPPTAKAKLGLGWVGPYKILSKLSDLTYKIEHTGSHKTLVVHVDHLKSYLGTFDTDSIDDANISEEEESLLDLEQDVVSSRDLAQGQSPEPETPYVTRTGRRVKPKVIFSPS